MTQVETITDPDRIVFPKLGIDVSINHTAFTIFGIDIQWYGIIITTGLILAMLYCFSKMKKRYGIDPDRAIDVIIGGIIGGIIGARTYFVIFKWDEYAGNWKEIINVRNGGLAIYGGIIGSFIVGMIICRIRKVKILPMMDLMCLGFLIGQSVGRWGNFVNQEAFGTNTDSLLGMTGGTIQNTIMDQMSHLDGAMYKNGLDMSEKNAVHPCFLYESIWCLLGFIIIASFSKHRKFDGQVSLMYAAWYGAGRSVIEGLRTDSLMAGNIRVSQALAVVLTLSSILLLTVITLKYKRMNGEGFVLYCNTDESKQLLAEAAAFKADPEGFKARKKAMAENKNENAETASDKMDDVVINKDVKNPEENKNGNTD